VTFLLDVNALIAVAVEHHEFHRRVAVWASRQAPGAFATCSITELGFVRVLANAPAYGYTLSQSALLLARLKKAVGMTFLTDDCDLTSLPVWVKNASQLTDGHLFALANAHGKVLATLDTRIPGAYLIPH
jgi:predicted nucleic acid-binding protein